MSAGMARAEHEPVVDMKIEKVIQSFVEKNSFSGVVLVQDGPNLVHLQSYGMAVREHQVPNHLDSIFRIGSLSKQFVAALVMSLQEQGLLSVEDPLSKFFDIPEHWEGITLKHLLTHTAGLKANLPINTDAKQIAAYHNPEELLESAKSVPLEYNTQLERHYHYSNIGYTLLAIVLQKVLGADYPNVLNGFAKKLKLSTLAVDHDSIITPFMSQGYVKFPAGDGRQSGIDVLNYLGAGDLRAGVQDLSSWVDILLGNQFLSEKSREEMWTAHTPIPSAIPGESWSYGYGWVVVNSEKNRLKIFHNGSLPGFTADLAIWPHENKRVIVLSNLRENILNQDKTSYISLVNAQLVREQIEKVLFPEPLTESCEDLL